MGRSPKPNKIEKIILIIIKCFSYGSFNNLPTSIKSLQIVSDDKHIEDKLGFKLPYGTIYQFI